MSRSSMHHLFRSGPPRHEVAITVAVLLAVGLASGCEQPPTRQWRPEDHGQPKLSPDDEARAAPTEAAELSPEQAKARATLALWNITCASCHARDGRGGGPGLPPGAKVPNLTDEAFSAARTDAQLGAVIRDGQGMMPAFGPQLGESGVAAMVAHVRTLSRPAQDAPAQDAPAP
jgi:mono/diheme cytochrome c family protein